MKKHMITIICSIVFLLIGGGLGFFIGFKVGTVNALASMVNKATNKVVDSLIKKD